jgi:hypothetical protein
MQPRPFIDWPNAYLDIPIQPYQQGEQLCERQVYELPLQQSAATGAGSSSSLAAASLPKSKHRKIGQD